MKHENKLYLVAWEVITVWEENLASLCNITKENFLSKSYMKNMTWKLVSGPF